MNSAMNIPRQSLSETEGKTSALPQSSSRQIQNAPKPTVNGGILSTHAQGNPKDVLLVSHEMSLTGAPRALLTLAVELKAVGYNPVIFALKTGR